MDSTCERGWWIRLWPRGLIVGPESFAVSPGHANSDALNAVVRRVTYLGNTTRLHLDAAGARLIADSAAARR